MRRILLAVTGLSPQIVTETLYALAVQPRNGRPWVPHEIRLITTARGKENARLTLLSREPGHFHRLRADYGLPEIAFTDNHIHVIEDAEGRPLDDIKNDDDNRRAADTIADVVRRLSQDDDTEIHASIAGGRKTMGFFLGYAMSLFGRPQDRLSHVLVSSPYESNRAFFYPTPHSTPIPANPTGSEMIDAKDAEVWLGEIPFVRLHHSLPRDSTEKIQIAFAEVVEDVQQRVAPTLTLDVARQTAVARGRPIPLSKVNFAFLWWIAERTKHNDPVARHKVFDGHAPDQARRDADEFLDHYAWLGDDPDDREGRTAQRLQHGLDGDFLSERITAIHKAFERALGKGHARVFRIERSGERGRSTYQLTLDPQHIHIQMEAPA